MGQGGHACMHGSCAHMRGGEAHTGGHMCMHVGRGSAGGCMCMCRGARRGSRIYVWVRDVRGGRVHIALWVRALALSAHDKQVSHHWVGLYILNK